MDSQNARHVLRRCCFRSGHRDAQQKELFCARIEDIDWNNRVFFIRDSKTDNGRRFVPLSDRALERLKARCRDRREGWIFPAFSFSGHLTTVDKKFRQARLEAGLPEKLVLYCGRHDYGTRVLQGTGNLAVVMRTMGHGSPSTAMKYQHPELEQVPARSCSKGLPFGAGAARLLGVELSRSRHRSSFRRGV